MNHPLQEFSNLYDTNGACMGRVTRPLRRLSYCFLYRDRGLYALFLFPLTSPRFRGII